MPIIDEYGNPSVDTNTGRRPKGLTSPPPDIEPWAGGVKAAAASANPAYEPWKGSVMPAAPASTAPAQVFGGTNPDNVNAPGTRRVPDDRGFK